MTAPTPGKGEPAVQGRRTLTARVPVEFTRAGRWAVHFVLIGLIAGLGAIVFQYATQLGLHYFLDWMAGYRPPSPAGEQHLLPPTATPFNRWVLLILPG